MKKGNSHRPALKSAPKPKVPFPVQARFKKANAQYHETRGKK